MFPLAGARVVEIGCGTGSSTAALARHVAHVQGYGIAPASVAAAQQRLDILGLTDRDSCFCVAPDQLLATMRAHTHGTDRATQQGVVDIVLFHAVREHQTVLERLDTLRECWDVLRDSIREALPKGHEKAAGVLVRWGRCVSYHEFELALGDLSGLVLTDGFAADMFEWLGRSLEEELLIDY